MKKNEKMNSERRNPEKRNKLTVRIRSSVQYVPFGDIIYMENRLRKIHLYLVDGEKEFYSTFAQVMEELDDRFLQCSRSFIINMDKITAMRVSGYQFFLSGGHRVTLSKVTFLRAEKQVVRYLEGRR